MREIRGDRAYHRAVDLRADGDLLVVRAGARIPKVCVKCGATQGVSRRDHAFALGSYGAGAGAAGGVVGAMLASTLRHTFRDEPGMQAAIIGGLLALVCVGAWVAQRMTPTLHLDVPLCGEHHARFDRAMQHRTWLLLAFAIAGVVLVFGIGVSSLALIGLAVVLAIGAIAAAFAAAMPKAWIPVRWAKDREVALALDPEITKKILERAERRARKADAIPAGGDEASPPA